MHTPEATLERGQAPPPYSGPIENDDEDGEEIEPHALAEPENNFDGSCDAIQTDFKSLKIDNEPNFMKPTEDSSPEISQPPYDLKQTWMNGIFACLRPVLSMIGKGVTENSTSQDNWEIPLESITELVYVGCGGQGAVFSGLLNNTPVAVKKVADLKESDIRNLRKLNHPNIVKFKGICIEERCFCIVMEFCPFGSLYDLLKTQKNVVNITRVVTWAKQIACGMHYLHTHKIIHRDLKSPNVLIGEEEIIKISDFGTSRTFNGVSEKMTFAGTVAWMAPEAIQEKACSEKVDIWSYGVVLWELLTCQVPYDGMEQSAIMFSVGSGKLRPPIPTTCPEGFKLIMQMCWKFVPKDRPSFKLILNHLEIASAEILSRYEDQQFFKTQQSWREEIKTHITQFVQLQKHKYQDQLIEEQLQKRKELEIQRIREVREMYVNKLQRVEHLYEELNSALNLSKQRYVAGSRKKRLITGFVRKCERRRPSNQSTTPTSPEQSLTSPDSPQKVPERTHLYAKLSAGTSTVTTQTSTSRKRHYRNSSGSPGSRNSRLVVDTGTQTDSMDISETDLSPTVSTSASFRQKRVILQEFKTGSDEEGVNNGNCVQLHFLDTDLHHEIYTRRDSRSPSPNMFDETDTVNKNINSHITVHSSDEYLDTIGRKVSEIKTNSIFLDNGNVGDITRKTTESRDEVDSTEDAGNEDSVSDDDNDLYNNYPLRRRSKQGKELIKPSLARRPVKRNRKLPQYHKEQNGSDEGNTSEYSVSPSSKSSTLESNPDRIRRLNMPIKRSNNERSDGSSDSESEENMTVVTQVSYPAENLV